MYALKVPTQSQFTQLNRALNNFLNDNKVEMKDRRLVTAYALARIAGGSLPVQDVETNNIRSRHYREQLLPTLKAWFDRVGEAIVIDHELGLIGAFLEWSRRCNVAFPREACIHDEAMDATEYGYQQQTAVLLNISKAYPNLYLPWEIKDLLTQRGA